MDGAERSLSARTVGGYEETARRLLAARAEQSSGSGAEGLTAGAVTAFLLGKARRGLAAGSLQGRVAELRSLLRFLHQRGFVGPGLAEAVPPVPGWKATGVPPRMAARDVRALLDSCDRSGATGRRNLAMLMLMARLGLRAAEVAGLMLEDIDRRSGELVVHGKGGPIDRMPPPADVGDSLVAYLADGRRRLGWRNVFVASLAPIRR